MYILYSLSKGKEHAYIDTRSYSSWVLIFLRPPVWEGSHVVRNHGSNS